MCTKGKDGEDDGAVNGVGVPGEDDADERKQSVLVDSGKRHLVVGLR